MPAPGQFLPRKSSAHRIACIALYRALLKQCPRIPLPDDVPLRGKINPIYHFVQKAFRKNANHTSPRLIVPALETGYAVHSLLQNAATSPSNAPNPSLTQLHTILRSLSQSYITAQASCPPKPPSTRKPPLRYPGAPKAIDIRPLPKEQLTGRRHVPKLVAVHGIFPFMRFKKPQSPYLSRVLTQKVKRKRKRFDRVVEMEDLADLGRLEDAWDREVREVAKKGGDGEEDDGLNWYADEEDDTKVPSGGSWSREPDIEKNATWAALTEEGVQARKLGDKMVEIIQQEQKLWEEERKERKHLKNEERKRKKMEKAACEGENNDSGCSF